MEYVIIVVWGTIGFAKGYGDAPCHQFEALFEKHKGRKATPPELIAVGLTPAARRYASDVVFIAVGGMVLLGVMALSDFGLEFVLVRAVISGVMGLVLGIALHYLTGGHERIRRVFEA